MQKFLLIGCLFFYSYQSISQSAIKINKSPSGIIADNATLQLISKEFSFTEGPAVDKYGNIFFTDQPNNKIWK
jgi:gluconolactonase